MEQNDRGVFNASTMVIGIIVVILGAGIGIFVLQLYISQDYSTGNAAVTVTQDEEKNAVTVQVVSMDADHVVVHNKESNVMKNITTVGETVTVQVDDDEVVLVYASSGEERILLRTLKGFIIPNSQYLLRF